MESGLCVGACALEVQVHSAARSTATHAMPIAHAASVKVTGRRAAAKASAATARRITEVKVAPEVLVQADRRVMSPPEARGWRRARLSTTDEKTEGASARNHTAMTLSKIMQPHDEAGMNGQMAFP